MRLLQHLLLLQLQPILLLRLLLLTPALSQQAPTSSYDGSARQSPPRPPAAGAWHTGAYRNLFSEGGMATAAESAAKVEAAFQQLFHGHCSAQRDAPTDQRLFFWADGALQSEAYIHSVDSHDVRSEGMSYGMMVAVQLGKRREFDALFCACSARPHSARARVVAVSYVLPPF
jgi:oligosaccharide reducing-end xylanase